MKNITLEIFKMKIKILKVKDNNSNYFMHFWKNCHTSEIKIFYNIAFSGNLYSFLLLSSHAHSYTV